MAIIDGLQRFSQAQAITTTAASTNVIDNGVGRDIGVAGYPLKVQIFVNAALTGGTSLQVQFQGSDDNSTWVTYAESDAIAAASLTTGAKLFPITVPHRKIGTNPPRYYRLNYVVVGTFGAGSVTSDLVLDRRDAHTYPSGITVTN